MRGVGACHENRVQSFDAQLFERGQNNGLPDISAPIAGSGIHQNRASARRNYQSRAALTDIQNNRA